MADQLLRKFETVYKDIYSVPVNVSYDSGKNDFSSTFDEPDGN